MNPADQRWEDRFLKRLTRLERQMEDIKTAQRLGLDNFVYSFTDVVSGHVFLDLGGTDHVYRINYIADKPLLYASELSLSFFINNDLDPDYHWPDGAAMNNPLDPPGTDSTGLRQGFQFLPWYDLFNSDELGVGRKTYYIYLLNFGAAKTVHMHATMVFPKGSVD